MDGKYNACLGAMEYVKDGMVLGLGSGTTVAHFINLIGEEVKNGKKFVCAATSFDSEMLAKRNGIPIVSLDQVSRIDLAVDGADTVAKDYVLKGGGGALAREKVVDYFADNFIVVVDEGKLKAKSYPVVVECLPFAYSAVMKGLEKMGAKPVLRTGGGKVGPVVSDNGNFLLDCAMKIADAEKLEQEINSIPGAVANGIFTRFSKIIVGSETGSREL
ncbi:MAG: ribose-5-phosphate isomerase RpiA [Candidatus Micrarchaeota archaeon]